MQINPHIGQQRTGSTFLQTSEWISTLRALDAEDRLQLDAERASRLREQFREDHERLAKRDLSREHAAVPLAPVADARHSHRSTVMLCSRA